jgi:hypothetical protein
MIETTFQSTIGANGELHLQLPAGFAPEGGKVTVKVRYQPNRFKNQEEYVAWVRSLGGTWEGEFHASELLPLEERKSL